MVTPLGAYLEAVARLAAEATARGDLEGARALLEAAGSGCACQPGIVQVAGASSKPSESPRYSSVYNGSSGKSFILR